jgi:hypothetical protein
MSTNMLLFAVVIAISLPLVLSAFETYDRLRTEDDLVNEIAKFINISVLYLDAGGGHSNITVRMRDGLLRHIDFVDFGGPLDSPQCASIVYKFTDGGPRYITLEDYGLRLTAIDGSLRLSAGIWKIHLEVRSDEFGAYMFLTIV